MGGLCCPRPLFVQASTTLGAAMLEVPGAGVLLASAIALATINPCIALPALKTCHDKSAEAHANQRISRMVHGSSYELWPLF